MSRAISVLEGCSSEHLAAERTIEALDESLLILLVRTCDTMAVGVVGDRLGKVFLELGDAIGLDDLTATKGAGERSLLVELASN